MICSSTRSRAVLILYARVDRCCFMKLHTSCRGGVYAGQSDVVRESVPDALVSWSVTWPDYAPPDFTRLRAGHQPWADNGPLSSFTWNALDGPAENTVDRRSHEGPYDVCANSGRPLNPHGRTGLGGRGLLGRWGPNHAADPLVTRWRRVQSSSHQLHDGARQDAATTDDTGGLPSVFVHPESGRPQLELVVIKRKDCGLWALPGGMVDPGELVSQTVLREFREEALDSAPHLSAAVERLFADGGRRVYAGYVDDRRNTDHAWMETVAVNFHDDDGRAVAAMPLQAGSDAGDVCWMAVSRQLQLYASHSSIVEQLVHLLHAHW